MDGEYENPEGLSGRGGPFFLVTFFFGPAKKKSLGRGSGRKPSLCRKPQSRWIPAFAGMTTKSRQREPFLAKKQYCLYCGRRGAANARPSSPTGKNRETQQHWSATMIRKLASGEYRLYSRKTDPKTGKRRNLGTFKTREKAEQHEREVQYFKRH
jgi:hypothetical protein